ncbi:hypothetical protein JXR93_01130, partial [bacterium]|nr:hypothetical protein [bacterium]
MLRRIVFLLIVFFAISNSVFGDGLDGYKIWGPFDIPAGAFIDFSSEYLEAKNFLSDGGYSGFNFDFDGEDYIELPILYSGSGLYFIQFFCKSSKNSKIIIDSSIDLDFEINNRRIDNNIHNFSIESDNSYFKVVIKGDFSYKTPLKIDIDNAVCGYDKPKNLELSNKNEKNSVKFQFIIENRDISDSKTSFTSNKLDENDLLSDLDKSINKILYNDLSIYDSLLMIEDNPEIINKLKKINNPKALKIVYEWEKTEENLINWHNSEHSFDSYRKILELKLEQKELVEAKKLYWEIIDKYFKLDKKINKSYNFFTTELLIAAKLFDFKRYIEYLERKSNGFDIDLQIKYLDYLVLNNQEKFKSYLSKLNRKYPNADFLDRYNGIKEIYPQFSNIDIDFKNIKSNKISLKEVVLEQKRDIIYEYRRYIYSIYDIHQFFSNFFPPKESDVLEINLFHNDEKFEISPKFIQNDLLISKVKNGSTLEIIYKIEHKKNDFYLFLQERYLPIDRFILKTKKNITTSKINFQFLKNTQNIIKESFINSEYILEVNDINKYDEEPFSPAPH